jgi:hypothetical protein
MQEAVDDLAQRLPSFPPIEFLGAAIPVFNYPLHVTNNNRIKSKIEELGLFVPDSYDPAYTPDQCSDYQRRNQKRDETGQILLELYIQAEYRLDKEKIEARNGDKGEKDGRDKTVQQGQQNNNDQINALSCNLVEPHLEARPGDQREQSAPR